MPKRSAKVPHQIENRQNHHPFFVASGKAAEYGVLKEGYMFESSTGLSRMLLSSPPYPVLEALGKKLSFEIAVGINGRFWVNASQSSTVILVGKCHTEIRIADHGTTEDLFREIA